MLDSKFGFYPFIKEIFFFFTIVSCSDNYLLFVYIKL